jgi:hypothetical protein
MRELSIIWDISYGIGEFTLNVLGVVISFVVQKTIDFLHFLIRGLVSVIA